MDDGPAACEPLTAMSLALALLAALRAALNPHRPRAREPGAPTAARPAQPPIEATPIRAPTTRPRDRSERGTSPSWFAELSPLLPRVADASRAREGCTRAARRRATRAGPRRC